MVNDTHLKCPHCNGGMSQDGNCVKCESNHSFDIAKEGYINLLPVNKKNSKDPGDSKEMIQARRSFLDAGYYHKLVISVQKIINRLLDKNSSIVDVGCGEGYYTNQLFGLYKDVIGLDISKHAIKLASKKYKNISFLVGSIYEIPMNGKSVDLALSIFTPLDENELARIIKQQGYLLVVSSGSNHMKEVAEHIYDEFKPHEYDPATRLSNQFSMISHEEISFDVQVEAAEARLQMIKMTPYYWSMNQKDVSLDGLSKKVTAHFKLSLFQRI